MSESSAGAGDLPPEPKHRFFVPPETFSGGPVVQLPPDISRQLATVLRLRPGARVLLLDNHGWEYLVELAGAQGSARILERRPAGGEPRLHLTLYAALLKGQHLEWVLQKGTELGVSAFVPILTQRTVVRAGAGAAFKKRARWERILAEAAEQCRRARLPRLADPCSFADACREAAADHDVAWMPTVWEGERSLTGALRRPPAERAALLIGPEGGFEEDEVRLAVEAGVEPVSLGPRTLRAETAALAAVTIVMERWGEMTTPPKGGAAYGDAA